MAENYPPRSHKKTPTTQDSTNIRYDEDVSGGKEEVGKDWGQRAAIAPGKQGTLCSWNLNFNLKCIYPWEP